MKNNKILAFTLLIILLSAVSVGVSAQTIEVTEAAKTDISLNEIITGTIAPIDEVDIPAQISGIADKVNIEIGDQVKKGDLLVKIDDESLLIQKRQAQAALDSARASYDELKNGATAEELDRVEASYEQAKTALASAQTNYKLMQELFNDRRSLEQQLVSAKQQLDNAQQSLNQSQVNYDQAERNYQRSKKLYNNNVISEKDYEDAEDAFDNAKTSLNQAKSTLQSAEKNYQLTKATYDNPTELKQQLENSRSQVENAKSSLAVAEANLKETKRGPREEQVRAGLAQVKQAEATLAEIDDNISKSKIAAPFTGLIAEVNVDDGEMISAGQTVVRLINIDQLYVEVNLTASTVSAIQTGEKVEVKAESSQNYVEGEIANISPAADPSNRTFLVKVKLANPDHRLRAGMFADVQIAKGQTGDAVVVPIDSIVGLNSDQPYLFVFQDGKAVRREITLGVNNNSQVEVKSGIEAGEKVIVRGQSDLTDGQEVEVKNQ